MGFKSNLLGESRDSQYGPYGVPPPGRGGRIFLAYKSAISAYCHGGIDGII
jgi:hypothetical protein